MNKAKQGKRTPAKERTSIAADDDLIERAYKALQDQDLKIYTKIELAKVTKLSRSTINKFFQKQEIRPDSYNQICETLALNEKIVIEERTAFAVSGTVEKKSIEQLKSIIDLLRQLADDTILVNIQEGSIKLIFEGYQSELEK
ncbi:hypothetical protein [Okeania sp. KiyG1]|uniref:hypothetical protein n=1 Tax=Okeania sp. KiyG1 TaxID=2720165 RepID=UPI0019236DFB|nr:hypothetical protein [Okeania sp. KiyG1]GGA11863.1 hypothetical protein CYANOKiyG1_24890 [Okeania sp. KiyG1]